MKLIALVGILVTSHLANANTLGAAFEDAMNRSNADLSQSRTSVELDAQARVAAWKTRKKTTIVLQGTVAVDDSIQMQNSKKIAKEYQVETDKYIQNELNNLEE